LISGDVVSGGGILGTKVLSCQFTVDASKLGGTINKLNWGLGKERFPAAFYLNSDVSVTRSTSRKEEVKYDQHNSPETQIN
jgi:hypothetical protein